MWQALHTSIQLTSSRLARDAGYKVGNTALQNHPEKKALCDLMRRGCEKLEVAAILHVGSHGGGGELPYSETGSVW